ncbi:MAG TPA: nuclear transport factor 2 family protein [Thermoanaerobaculia bacterium]
MILVGVSFASDKPRADASALEIERLERAWAECFVTGVPGAARDFIADDFVGVSSKGVPYGKAQGLQDILDSKGQFRSFVVSGVKVRLYGNAAVAQGSDAWEGTDGSKGSSLWTDTWIRTGDRWQIVAGQDTQPKSQP